MEQENNKDSTWPSTYTHRESGKVYQPHHADEAAWVYDNEHRYLLAKGGEGSGKSVAGIIKDLNKLKLGLNGILVSPDLQHFKKSLWPEFKRWCPPEVLIPSQKYRLRVDWEPTQPFALSFVSGATLMCGGIEEPGSWEGPNVHFAHFDEARRHKTPEALKVLDGRIRIPGPNGEPPQLWMTTTPRKHWLFEYFGPLKEHGEPDLRANFKSNASVISLKTEDNERAGNLAAGYTRNRGNSLTESEARVLLNAEWEDTNDADKFLPSMTYWDTCIDPALGPHNPQQAMVLAADCGTVSDCFALVGVCRHPVRHDEIAVRYCRLWKPTPGNPVSLMEVEKEIVELAERLHIVQIAYDPYQLKSMMERLYVNHGIWTEEFNQMAPREKADKQLLDMITNRQVWHDGTFSDLREHLDNADQKKSGVEGEQKMRIVKRESSQKVDAAVAFSMAVDRCLELNLY